MLAPSLAERLLGLLFETGSMDRARALLREAKGVNPDIVAFQEVTAGFMTAITQDSGWAGYHASVSGHGEPPGGLLVLSRYPFAKIVYRKLPSPSGRSALFATLDLGSEPLVVANVHLESLREDRAARAIQMEFVDAHMPHRGLAVVMGDFNFGDQDPEDGRLMSWTDAWIRLRPAEAGHTYDLDANPLARKHAFAAEPSRRLDRILTSPRLVPTAVGLTGQVAGPSGPPSDHYGVWADLAQDRYGDLGLMSPPSRRELVGRQSVSAAANAVASRL